MASIYIRSSGPSTFSDCDREAQKLGATTPVYIIEPVPQRFKRLIDSDKIKNHTEFHLFNNYVVGTKEGETTLNLADHRPELASLHNFSKEIFHSWSSRKGDWKFTGTKDVERIRLDNFIDRYGISTVDYLRIDGCQGNNFDVLKSLGEKISTVKAGFCKSRWFLSMYDSPKDENALAISKFLLDNGFVVEVVSDSYEIPVSFTGIKRAGRPSRGAEATIHFKRRLLGRNQ